MDDNIKTISTAAKRLGGNLGKVDGTLKPLLRCEYVMKALQNGGQINDLTWNSTGDKSNYNADGTIKLPVWHRYGISCCANGKTKRRVISLEIMIDVWRIRTATNILRQS